MSAGRLPSQQGVCPMMCFTIGDVLWLTVVVVAVWAGWWADKRKYKMQIKRLEYRCQILEGR
jgi:hypothetical protein